MANDPEVVVPVNGVVYPQWAVGFPRPFGENSAVRFADDRIVSVDGESEVAGILRDMPVGGQLIELGCGHNPRAPRHPIHPAGCDSPGALHYGIDLARPSDDIRRVLPEWEEPPVHRDRVRFDSTTTAGNASRIENGFLAALREPEVVAAAARHGDPVGLLEAWPD